MNAKDLLENSEPQLPQPFGERPVGRPGFRRPGGNSENTLDLCIMVAALAAHADEHTKEVALAVANGQPIPESARQHIAMEAKFLADKLPPHVQARLDQLAAAA